MVQKFITILGLLASEIVPHSYLCYFHILNYCLQAKYENVADIASPLVTPPIFFLYSVPMQSMNGH